MRRAGSRAGRWALGFLVAWTVFLAGCYTDSPDGEADGAAAPGTDGNAGDFPHRADVVIRFGGGDRKAIPETIDRIDLRVSGPNIDPPYSQSFDVSGSSQDFSVDLTFPVGPDALFEVDALRDIGDDVFVIYYQGATLTDLVAGPNTVIIPMQGRAYVNGRILFLWGVGGSPDEGNPLENFTETEGPIPIQTDANGYYIAMVPTDELVRIEVNPDLCLARDLEGPDIIWADCFAFAELEFPDPGQDYYLDLFVIPNDPERFPGAPFACAVYPMFVNVGQEITVFGMNFIEEEFPPSVGFDWPEPVYTDANQYSDDWLTATVPAGTGVGNIDIIVATGEPVKGLTNTLPLTVFSTE